MKIFPLNLTAKSLILCLLFIIFFSGCGSKKTERNDNTFEELDTIDEYDVSDIDNRLGIGRLRIYASNDTLYINSVKGHDERDTIVGNFTGNGIDTLYVERVVECKCNNFSKAYDEDEHLNHEMDDELVKYYLTSTNPALGRVELFGCALLAPRLVNEGDLDGNETCEVGYLPVWLTSQWRGYFIFTFKDGKWKYLINPTTETKDKNGGGLFETGYLLRGSGYEIATPSGKKGLVRIKYETQGVNAIIKDTLVTPDYKEIK